MDWSQSRSLGIVQSGLRNCSFWLVPESILDAAGDWIKQQNRRGRHPFQLHFLSWLCQMYFKYCLRLWEHKDESMTAPPWNEILAEELIPTDQSEVEAVIVCVCMCVCGILCMCAHLHVFCLSHSIMSILIAFFHCNYALGKTSMRSQNPQYLFQVTMGRNSYCFLIQYMYTLRYAHHESS